MARKQNISVNLDVMKNSKRSLLEDFLIFQLQKKKYLQNQIKPELPFYHLMCPSGPEICPTGPPSKWESLPPTARIGWCWRSKVLDQPKGGQWQTSTWSWMEGARLVTAEPELSHSVRDSLSHTQGQYCQSHPVLPSTTREARDRAALSRESANRNLWGYSHWSIANVGSCILGRLGFFLITCLFIYFLEL